MPQSSAAAGIVMDRIIISLFKMSASSSFSHGSVRVTALLCSVVICGGDCTGI